jgi:sugar phosphate isomerase/epimerase
MSLPNPLILTENHFFRHRRRYPIATRFAIAADLRYDGYELTDADPKDETTWDEIRAELDRTEMAWIGMYVVVRAQAGFTLDQEISRVGDCVERLSGLGRTPFLVLTITVAPWSAAARFHESGSAVATAAHWDLADRVLRDVDAMLTAKRMPGYLYNHGGFLIDTPAVEERLVARAQPRRIVPGLSTFHAYFHEAVADPPEILASPGMRQLGYVALHSGYPKPHPYRTTLLDEGQIDTAGWLALLWQRGYRGPIALQAYDVGGDPYVSAERQIRYVHSVWDRFQRNPRLNPTQEEVPRNTR